jgi:hypothetical protein
MPRDRWWLDLPAGSDHSKRAWRDAEQQRRDQEARFVNAKPLRDRNDRGEAVCDRCHEALRFAPDLLGRVWEACPCGPARPIDHVEAPSLRRRSG